MYQVHGELNDSRSNSSLHTSMFFISHYWFLYIYEIAGEILTTWIPVGTDSQLTFLILLSIHCQDDE